MFTYQERSINYLILGEKGDWIVFLHGWGGSIDSFLCIANQLKQSYRCLLIDFPAHGKSEEPSTPQDLNYFVECIHSLINFLDIKKLIFISHSFGGRVAISFACKYNQIINKMILFDSAGLKPRRNISYYYKVLHYKILKKIKSKKLEKFGSDDYKKLSPVMKKTFINIVNKDLSNECKLIKCPTLLIYGKKDKDTPIYMAKKLNKLISNSELVIYQKSGHFSYIEEFNKTLIIVKYYLRS